MEITKEIKEYVQAGGPIFRIKDIDNLRSVPPMYSISTSNGELLLSLDGEIVEDSLELEKYPSWRKFLWERIYDFNISLVRKQMKADKVGMAISR